MNNNGKEIQIKKEILVRIIEAFYSDDFEENTRLIPFDMRPKGAEVPYRCCIHKERAIIKDRTIAGLGFAIEDDDERTTLATYAKNAMARTELQKGVLTVLQDACKGCVPSQYYVTDLCQGCVARPCEHSCKFGAVKITEGRSKIDPSKCKKCGMCMSACPYNAIVKITVPCESACPVGAISKDETGFAHINFDRCISCGKCIMACPFGAVHEKSQIIDILKAL
ncbi:4Fe-4S binding protein, partial [bacterium]|nr:4Fe-4S binding protein [bacterium]